MRTGPKPVLRFPGGLTTFAMSDEPADAGELPAGDMPEAEGQEAPAQDPVAEEAPAAEDTGTRLCSTATVIQCIQKPL